MDSMVGISKLRFIQSSDGRVGVGHCPDKDEGGFEVLLWCPPEMANRLAKTLLEKVLEDL